MKMIKNRKQKGSKETKKTDWKKQQQNKTAYWYDLTQIKMI